MPRMARRWSALSPASARALATPPRIASARTARRLPGERIRGPGVEHQCRRGIMIGAPCGPQIVESTRVEPALQPVAFDGPVLVDRDVEALGIAPAPVVHRQSGEGQQDLAAAG